VYPALTRAAQELDADDELPQPYRPPACDEHREDATINATVPRAPPTSSIQPAWPP
jgi:hypothetical protein